MRRVIIGDRKAFADITDAHVGRLYLRDGSWHASADVRTKGISGSKEGIDENDRMMKDCPN